MSPVREPRDLRLFFALWPDERVRRELQQAGQTIALCEGARYVTAANLHLTLHFIGNVDHGELPCLKRQARKVFGRGFELVIEGSGCFSKPKVGWLGCEDIPPALGHLHQELGSRLGECGFEPEKRPFRPHVTVLRKYRASPPKPEFEPIRWPVGDFSLVESRSGENGVQYRVLETYPLT